MSGGKAMLAAVRTAVILGLLVGLIAPAAALAKRPPTQVERAAIAKVVLADVRVPASYRSCLQARVVVSTANPAWAMGETLFPGRCQAVASNGYVLLHRQARWRVAWRGSDMPRCSSTTVPAAVSRDLVGCRP